MLVRLTFILIFLALNAQCLVKTNEETLLPNNTLPLPIVTQATNYSCGAAAFLSILQYWGYNISHESELYEILETTEENGTHPRKLESAGLYFGLQTQLFEKMNFSQLRNLLQQKATVIINIQAWTNETSPDWVNIWEDGHYVVLIGMDFNFAYFMDPSLPGAYGYIELNEFRNRWHDYEIEDGQRRPFYQLGIAFKGTHPALYSHPTRLIKKIM